MTPDELKARVAQLDGGDAEVAHYELDDIWYEVLKVIADCEGGYYGELAKTAIDALDKVPTRWYA